MSSHPVVDDCAPVVNCNTVNTGSHIVNDSVDLCVELISSWSVIDKATCISLALHHTLSEGDVLGHVVEAILICIAIAKHLIHLIFALLQFCGVS